MRCEADFEDVAEATHLESFEAASLRGAGSPTFRAIEEGCDDGCGEDSDFGFDGDFWAAVENGLEAPETV